MLRRSCLLSLPPRGCSCVRPPQSSTSLTAASRHIAAARKSKKFSAQYAASPSRPCHCGPSFWQWPSPDEAPCKKEKAYETDNQHLHQRSTASLARITCLAGSSDGLCIPRNSPVVP